MEVAVVMVVVVVVAPILVYSKLTHSFHFTSFSNS